MTMILLTHEIRSAEDVADRFILLLNGSIVEGGPTPL